MVRDAATPTRLLTMRVIRSRCPHPEEARERRLEG
jgi:hypothetical protein